MPVAASVLDTPRSTYRGAITDPDRWGVWKPSHGDIIVCTPPKCGTTWTQTMAVMLLHGGPDLPEAVPVMSPWVGCRPGRSGTRGGRCTGPAKGAKGGQDTHPCRRFSGLGRGDRDRCLPPPAGRVLLASQAQRKHERGRRRRTHVLATGAVTAAFSRGRCR